MRETPAVTRDYCPACEPNTDPLRELVIERWCYRHAPERAGLDDALVRESTEFIGTALDVDGAENRQRCDLIHRGDQP